MAARRCPRAWSIALLDIEIGIDLQESYTNKSATAPVTNGVSHARAAEGVVGRRGAQAADVLARRPQPSAELNLPRFDSGRQLAPAGCRRRPGSPRGAGVYSPVFLILPRLPAVATTITWRRAAKSSAALRCFCWWRRLDTGPTTIIDACARLHALDDGVSEASGVAAGIGAFSVAARKNRSQQQRVTRADRGSREPRRPDSIPATNVAWTQAALSSRVQAEGSSPVRSLIGAPTRSGMRG